MPGSTCMQNRPAVIRRPVPLRLHQRFGVYPDARATLRAQNALMSTRAGISPRVAMRGRPVGPCRMCDGARWVHWDGVSLVPSSTANPEAEGCLACAPVADFEAVLVLAAGV